MKKQNFKDGFATGFSFAVPDAFSDSLEKGVFNQGDTFYDSPDAYKLEWAKYLKKAKHILQVDGFTGSKINLKVLSPSPDKNSVLEKERRCVSSDELIEILEKGL